MEFVVSWGRKLLEALANAYNGIIFVLNFEFEIPGQGKMSIWQLMAFILSTVLVVYIVARIVKMFVGD